VGVDAEDLLDDDHAATWRALRIGPPSSNRPCAFRFQFNPTAHGFSRVEALARAALRNGDPADDEDQRDDVIGGERLAE
jgi:hypothetical protein